VGYTGIRGSLTVTPLPDLSLRARGIRFWFEETETETPLARVEDRGWQVAIGATYAVRPDLVLSADHATEFGPGGSSASLSGSVSWLPQASLSLSVLGGRLNRPLEFRFDEATLYHAGLEADWRISAQWHATVSATRFFEERDRPDAAAFDWDQTRLHARVTLLLRSETDVFRLPPALRTRPRAGSR
jgi:hypothetical protein